jgi:hypothetical protein
MEMSGQQKIYLPVLKAVLSADEIFCAGVDKYSPKRDGCW